MSDRQPLLPQHAQQVAQRTQQRVSNAMPSRQEIERQADISLAAIVRVVGALGAGKLPTQDQLNTIGQKLLKSPLLDSNAASNAASRAGVRGRSGARLSEAGDAVVEDVRAVIEAVLRIGAEKNGDDKIQEFLYTSLHADIDVDGVDPQSLVGVSADEARADAREAVESIKSVGQLVLSSTAFRSILSDATIILRDLAADAAEVAADAAKQAADGASTAAEKAREAAGKARPSEQERQQGADLPKLPSTDEARAKADELANRASAQAKDARGRGQKALKQARQYIDEKTPDDAADQAIERVKKLVVDVQKDPQYRDAVSNVVNLVKKYGKAAQNAAEQAVDQTDVKTNDEAQDAISQFKAIIETLAGGKEVDPLIDAVKKVGQDIDKSDELKKLANSLEEYVDRLLFDPGFAVSNKASRQFESIRKEARAIADKDATWKQDIERLSDEFQSLWTSFANDRAFAQLGRALDRLGDDLADLGRTGKKEGSRALTRATKGFAQDLTDVWIPRLLGMIHELPMPRVEYKSASFDFAIDDVSFRSASFQPDLIRIVNRNDFAVYKGYAATASELDTSLTLIVRGLRLQADNISYWLHKKTGVIPYQDSGKVDIRFGTHNGDDGLHFKVKFEPSTGDDKETFFTAGKVEVELDNFDLKIHDSQHSILNWLATPALRVSIAKLLEDALSEQIRSAVHQLDLTAYGVQQRAVAAGQSSASPAEYLRALVKPAPKPFTKRPKASLTKDGIRIVGPKGESVLVIGAPDSIFDAEAGQGIKHEARSAIARAREAAEDARNLAADARDRLDDAASDARREARRQAAKDGWKSDAFDL